MANTALTYSEEERAALVARLAAPEWTPSQVEAWRSEVWTESMIDMAIAHGG